MSDTRAGWMDFLDSFRAYSDRPSNHRLIWIWRTGWVEPQLTPYHGINPTMNVNGLMWQPAFDGVGRPLLPSLQDSEV